MNTIQDGEHPCDSKKAECFCMLPSNDGHTVHKCVCGGSWDLEGNVVTLPIIGAYDPLGAMIKDIYGL